ncbi:hypothetical protein QL285_025956 [Trifolium repens]|nr:hypothetical protein QL285_025956 [Trifolium repens]
MINTCSTLSHYAPFEHNDLGGSCSGLSLKPNKARAPHLLIRAPKPCEHCNGQRYQAYRNGRHRTEEHLRLIMAFQPFSGSQLMAIYCHHWP